MRTGLQHFAFRDVIARIQSLEDVSPEAWYSHGPGADRRFLSSLSCQTSVSVKQQLAADAEQSSSLSSRPSCWCEPGERSASPPALPGPQQGTERGALHNS